MSGATCVARAAPALGGMLCLAYFLSELIGKGNVPNPGAYREQATTTNLRTKSDGPGAHGRRSQRSWRVCVDRAAATRRTVGCIRDVSDRAPDRSGRLRQIGRAPPISRHAASSRNVRFALRAEHVTLLGLSARAYARRCTRSHRTPSPRWRAHTSATPPLQSVEVSLLGWMHAHLESFSGVIAIDDLHVADGDPEVAQIRQLADRANEGKSPVDSRLTFDDGSSGRNMARLIATRTFRSTNTTCDLRSTKRAKAPTAWACRYVTTSSPIYSR